MSDILSLHMRLEIEYPTPPHPTPPHSKCTLHPPLHMHDSNRNMRVEVGPSSLCIHASVRPPSSLSKAPTYPCTTCMDTYVPRGEFRLCQLNLFDVEQTAFAVAADEVVITGLNRRFCVCASKYSFSIKNKCFTVYIY